MKATMSNIGKQESQNDYMHTHRRKNIKTYPQLDTNFLAVTRKKLHPVVYNKHQIELHNELHIIEPFYKIHN
jgi:hypothetical protein